MYKLDALTRVRRDIEGAVGQRVELCSIGGRRKIAPRRGVLEKAYSSVFTVALTGGGTLSYNYTDVLTGAIEITVY